MPEQRKGPRLMVVSSCLGCAYVLTTSYRVQGDSGTYVFCAHSAHAGIPRKVGDTNWTTPEWCPELPAAQERFLRELAGS